MAKIRISDDSIYYFLWHADQKARRDYFDPYIDPGNGSNSITEAKSIITTFLDEYNRRHSIPITLREYLMGSDNYG